MVRVRLTNPMFTRSRRRQWKQIGTLDVKVIKNNVQFFASSVYAVGEGWTGALGTGRLDQSIVGHFDEDDESHAGSLPIRIFDGNVKSCSLGWGHTAIISSSPLTDTSSEQNQLFVTGRPQDFTALMRLRRLPKVLRNYSVRQTLKNTSATPEAIESSFNPVTVVGRLVSWLSDTLNPGTEDWEHARRQSSMAHFTSISDFSIDPNIHNNIKDDSEPVDANNFDIDKPIEVVCSAGFTAFRTESGSVYTFGLNGLGQCGVGYTSNNVWNPEKVCGLSTELSDGPRAQLQQTYPITNVALGLQHSLCLNSEGELFAWGKGERGQLGQEAIQNSIHCAVPITKAVILQGGNNKPIYHQLGKIQQIGAGMIHSAALDDSNNVYVWGKNLLPKVAGQEHLDKSALDAKLPLQLTGLPKNLKVEQIACGSHHTAVLLEDGSVWATGVSSDTKEAILVATCLIPAGVITLPVRYFAAHMDRTSIVGADGRQVFQVNLWSSPDLQEYALFTPIWIQNLLDADPTLQIREVHRSWLHSVVITD